MFLTKTSNILVIKTTFLYIAHNRSFQRVFYSIFLTFFIKIISTLQVFILFLGLVLKIQSFTLV